MFEENDLAALSRIEGGRSLSCGLGSLGGALIGFAFGGAGAIIGGFIGGQLFC